MHIAKNIDKFEFAHIESKRGLKVLSNRIAVKPRLSRLKKNRSTNKATELSNEIHANILTDSEKLTLANQRNEERKAERRKEVYSINMLSSEVVKFKRRKKRKK